MDYDGFYERISGPFRGAGARRALTLADRLLVVAFALAYAALVVALAVMADVRLAKALLVPAATFAVVTALRIAINRARPYEAHPIDPLVLKDTQGKSMPSRHMASAVVIACTLLWLWPPLGVASFIGCFAIAFTRIVGGVHYPSDIAAATLIALACALVGYVVIP